MIPYLIPPLSGLSILVTRPALQSASLNNRLIALGAQVTLLPVIEIISRECQLPGQRYDLLIFISSNAVHHGQAILAAQPQARIAAVGTSPAQALISSGHQVDVTPELSASSEALLNHPLLKTPTARGWQGECVLADSPEESSLISSLTRWHTRARSELIR